MKRGICAILMQSFIMIVLVVFSFGYVQIDASQISLASGQQSYDICVYGATSAGVIAAYTARKMGKSVILVEPGIHLGGLSSGGLGATDIGNKFAITGIARDFYRRMGTHYGKLEQWAFEPSAATAVFEQYLNDVNLKVLYNRRIVDVNKIAGIINSIVTEDSRSPDAKTNKIIKAAVFIDCTYEGDLMARAGVSYTVGREANAQYNETWNGVQLLNRHQLPDGIDPYIIPGKPESGLLWGVSGEKVAANGTGDKKVQAYNFRACLTDDPGNMIHITRPEGYDSSHYEILARLFKIQPEKRIKRDYFLWSNLPNGKTDVNHNGGFANDMIGMNHGYADGTYEERARIVKNHELFTKGLFYFIGHDPRVPAELQKEILRYGYPKDEYINTGNWSPQLYIREARRMVGSYVMTQHNCEGERVVEDGIGLAAYQMDSHNCQRVVVEKEGKKMIKNEGNVEISGFGPYPIAYRSIVPEEKECGNLLVPVCMSATHIAYGSIRMEPVFMVLAQSAAQAAVMAIDNKTTVQKIDVVKLQNALKANPMLDNRVLEVCVDNENTNNIRVKGNWKIFKSWDAYGQNALMSDTLSSELQTVQFIPNILRKGKYNVYVYISKAPRMSSHITLNVSDGNKLKEITIDLDNPKEWFHLGKYELPAGKKAYVEVTSKGADGITFADAVLCIPDFK